jgi:hypothetical protein
MGGLKEIEVLKVPRMGDLGVMGKWVFRAEKNEKENLKTAYE